MLLRVVACWFGVSQRDVYFAGESEGTVGGMECHVGAGVAQAAQVAQVAVVTIRVRGC